MLALVHVAPCSKSNVDVKSIKLHVAPVDASEADTDAVLSATATVSTSCSTCVMPSICDVCT